MLSGELDTLDESINMTVFRVIQESITNAVRHANATKMTISVNRQINELGQDGIDLKITDDGKGMEVTDFHSDVDFGLLGMRERAQSMGGEFELISALGEGVTIHVTLPLEIGKTL
jgi:signal transduction histidine kinase